MSELLKRGFNIYKIFLRNKLAMSLMMFIPGLMMFIGALNGHGNNTVMMPLGITTVGAVITFWSFYRIGYLKSNCDRLTTSAEQKASRYDIAMQIGETLLYLAVTAVGIFLLLNQSFTDQVLNLIAGFFTTLNGIVGAIYVYKHRDHRDFRLYFKIVLTVIELGFGLYFIFASRHIELGWFTAMGALTVIAGAIEVISAISPDTMKSTLEDSKNIVKIIKNKQ